MADTVAVNTIYVLLSPSPSVKNGHLMRITLDASYYDDLPPLSGFEFARIAGPTLPDIGRAAPGFRRLRRPRPVACNIPRDLLRSLMLCIQCQFYDPTRMSYSHPAPEDTHCTLRACTQILLEHRNAFPGLTSVRLEMRPLGEWILDLFMLVARDDDRECQDEEP